MVIFLLLWSGLLAAVLYQAATGTVLIQPVLMFPLFWSVLLATVIYEVATGTALLNGWKPWIRREARPGAFGVVITLQVATLLLSGVVWVVAR